LYYYADHTNAKGYISIIGTAKVIDNKELLVQKKRDYWEKDIKNWKDIFVLIEITPNSMEVTNYSHGISGDPERRL
jgi:hypothetical protein